MLPVRALHADTKIVRELICSPQIYMLRVPAKVLAEATDDYAALKRLGEGSFAAVFIGRIPSHRHNEIVGTGEAGGEAAKEELTSGPVAIKLLFERPEDGVSEEQREYYRKAEEVSAANRWTRGNCFRRWRLLQLIRYGLWLTF